MSESASGEASDSCSDGDKDSSVVCTVCSETFSTNQGMKIHRGKQHGKLTKSCERCSTDFEIEPNRTDSARFCSEECRDEQNGERLTLPRVTLECKQCNSEFKAINSNAEERKFCSQDCLSDHRRERLTFECERCGETYERIKCFEDKTKYCSVECKNNVWAERYAKVGSKNHMWSGGRYGYYGPNWNEQREKALERDEHTCQLCGLDESEHWRSLAVHHIVKREKFKLPDGTLDYQRANRLENLITFCDSCHKKAEQISPLLPPSASE